MKVLRVLSRVLYSFIENYVCIDFLGCKYKKLSTICSDKIFSGMSYNSFLGIGIPEVLMNLISCHGFMKELNSTVIILCRTRLVEYYLEKEFVILEYNSENLSSVSNEEKQRIYAINMHKTDFVMACDT